MPVGALNKLRREALDALLEARGNVKPIPFTELPMPSHKAYHRPKGELPVRVVLRDAGQFCPEMAGCEGVCLPIETDAIKLDGLRDMGARLILDLPRAVFGRELELRSLIEERKAMGFTEYLCGNLGTLQAGRYPALGLGSEGALWPTGGRRLCSQGIAPWQIPPEAVLGVKPPAFSQTVKGPAFRLYAG